MKVKSIRKTFTISLSISAMLLAGLFMGKGSALASSANEKVRAMQNLQIIRSNYHAAKRQYELKVRVEGVQARKSLPSTWLRKVDPSEVCMITNRHEHAPQAQIVINGKTYYGSCEGCAENIKSNPSVRFARDPYTNRLVDKAEAVPFADASGRVWYFQSENNKTMFLSLVEKSL
jgi:YHS domain-containing protein